MPRYTNIISTFTFSSLAQASIPMGSRGVDLPAIASKLGAIKDSTIIAESDAVSHTDIPAFLKAEREEAILGLLEETKKETVERLQVVCHFQ